MIVQCFIVTDRFPNAIIYYLLSFSWRWGKGVVVEWIYLVQDRVQWPSCEHNKEPSDFIKQSTFV
jgi:hypothetical protein